MLTLKAKLMAVAYPICEWADVRFNFNFNLIYVAKTLNEMTSSTVPVTILNTKILESFLQTNNRKDLTSMLNQGNLEIGGYEWTYPCHDCGILYMNLIES